MTEAKEEEKEEEAEQEEEEQEEEEQEEEEEEEEVVGKRGLDFVTSCKTSVSASPVILAQCSPLRCFFPLC